MKTAILIAPDGTTTEVQPRDGKNFTRRELRTLVGGDLAELSLKGTLIYCDAEGMSNNRPPNAAATEKAITYGWRPVEGEVLFGPVLFIDRTGRACEAGRMS